MGKKTRKSKLKCGNKHRTRRGGQKGGGIADSLGIDIENAPEISDINKLENKKVYIIANLKNTWSKRYVELDNFKYKGKLRVPKDVNKYISEDFNKLINKEIPVYNSTSEDSENFKIGGNQKNNVRFFLINKNNINDTNGVVIEYVECYVRFDWAPTRSWVPDILKRPGSPTKQKSRKPEEKTSVEMQPTNKKNDKENDKEEEEESNPEEESNHLFDGEPNVTQSKDDRFGLKSEKKDLFGGGRSKKRRHKKKHRRKSRKR